MIDRELVILKGDNDRLQKQHASDQLSIKNITTSHNAIEYINEKLKSDLFIAQKIQDDDRAEALQFYHQVRNALGLQQTYEIDYTSKLSEMIILIKAAADYQQQYARMRVQLVKMLENEDDNDGHSCRR